MWHPWIGERTSCFYCRLKFCGATLATCLSSAQRRGQCGEARAVLTMSSLSREASTALAIGSAVTLALAATWYHQQSKKNQPPSKWRQVGQLSSLWCYPIKSCAVIELKDALCATLGVKNGLIRDRVFMVTREDFEFKTARTYPSMTLVKPKIDGVVVSLSAPGMPDISFSIASLAKEKAAATVWGQKVEVQDCGDEVAKWFSQYILKAETGCRLVYYPSDMSTRSVKPKHKSYTNVRPKDAGGLSDFNSYMIINQSSIDDLNTRLPEGTDKTTALQFRPNFVVKGNTKAYEEDDWKWIKIGETIFQVTKPCDRCIFTTINPQTGERDPGMEPLKTLKTYRQITDPARRPFHGDSPIMGQHIAVYKEGRVSVGDAVYVQA
ncbi:mitochondrial amidoxime-reducing component 1-like [Neocloeon triangulifer]|uniref:mitochondrial amidoxime-reducing component 1-like n=1 Tax=Neocloeon triangulifer TaxID=2078957 RepID=UPI00286F8261|nr:mitochondrial amidoxime-reducing component 1-like [Neocloeon triangulifer]